MRAALFAAGAWLGRDLTGGVGIVAFIAAFATLFGMRFAAQRSVPLTVGLLEDADAAKPAHLYGRRHRDMTLGPRLRTAGGRNREDEPSLSQADRADQKPAGLLRQSDHVACLKITRPDQFIHNQDHSGRDNQSHHPGKLVTSGR